MLACLLESQTFPKGMAGLLFSGFAGEVWIEPGKAPSQGRVYREKREGKAASGGVSLVLGECLPQQGLLVPGLHWRWLVGGCNCKAARAMMMLSYD